LVAIMHLMICACVDAVRSLPPIPTQLVVRQRVLIVVQTAAGKNGRYFLRFSQSGRSWLLVVVEESVCVILHAEQHA
jgi:hypothetical protein